LSLLNNRSWKQKQARGESTRLIGTYPFRRYQNETTRFIPFIPDIFIFSRVSLFRLEMETVFGFHNHPWRLEELHQRPPALIDTVTAAQVEFLQEVSTDDLDPFLEHPAAELFLHGAPDPSSLEGCGHYDSFHLDHLVLLVLVADAADDTLLSIDENKVAVLP
jgi:hypothetical protein